jgi:MAGUK p55 subfamily protein 5
LKIVDQQDPKWWQAHREVNGGKTGIIPSKQLQERRLSMHQAEENRSVYRRPTRASWWKRWRTTRKSKNSRKLQTTAEYSFTELVTYEEVAKIEPATDKHRPVIIIGAPGIGRTTLKRFLLDNEPDKYSYPVPTTTRSRKASEVDGSDYNFMQKARMIEAIQQNQFVEFGEHKGNYYGTSLESIRKVVNQGKVAVLTVHPQALHILKGTDLKPFVVFIKPPRFDQLRETRRTQLSESKSNKTLTDDDLWELMQESARIYKLYSHYIDCVVVNDDVNEAFQELKQHIDRLETEPQWVPAVWVH